MNEQKLVSMHHFVFSVHSRPLLSCDQTAIQNLALLAAPFSSTPGIA